MSRLLHALSTDTKEDVRTVMTKKDAEINRLKAKLSELYMENDELIRENRKLRIRNGELDAAYTSLKEILRKRGTSTS